MKKQLLTVGTTGANVKKLQKVLHYLLNASILEDGIFGGNTAYWVKLFQKRNNLKTDAIVGQKTYLALERNLEAAKRFIVTIDAGHGGVIDDKYTTKENGKGKCYRHEGEDFGHLKHDPALFCEGVHNRQILKRLSISLDSLDIEYVITSLPQIDNSLDSRVLTANHVFIATGYSGLNLSLHSNAGKARGIIAFTDIGNTFSDLCSMYILRELQKDKLFGSMKWKHKKYGTLPYIWDNDNKEYATQKSDREKRFKVLRELENRSYSNRAGSVLMENDFFDNREGALFINKPANQERYVSCLVDAIIKIKEASINNIPSL